MKHMPLNKKQINILIELLQDLIKDSDGFRISMHDVFMMDIDGVDLEKYSELNRIFKETEIERKQIIVELKKLKKGLK